MTYQAQSQFAPNRLSEEAAAAAEQAAANAPLDQNVANLAPLPVQAAGISTQTGPAATVTPITTTTGEVVEAIDEKLVHRLTKAATTALSSDGNPTHLKALEELISL